MTHVHQGQDVETTDVLAEFNPVGEDLEETFSKGFLQRDNFGSCRVETKHKKQSDSINFAHWCVAVFL